LIADVFGAVGAVEDEIRVEERLEFGIAVELLTQQFTGPSARGVKIEKDELVFGFGLGHRLVKRSFEPGLGRGCGCE
jgi:hypothetical protein